MTQEKRKLHTLIVCSVLAISLIGIHGRDLFTQAMPAKERYMMMVRGENNLLQQDYTGTSLYRITNLTKEISVQAELTPPESARLQAYVAGIYYDALLQKAQPKQAEEAAIRLSEYCLPEYAVQIRDNYHQEFSTLGTELDFGLQGLLDLYMFRAGHDNFTETEEIVIPTDLGGWLANGDEIPLSPLAGSWSHWLVPEGTVFEVEPPIERGTAEYQEQEEQVVAAVANSTPEQKAAAQYWGGFTDKGVYPADLWLSIMYEELPDGLSDLEIAKHQKLLTQSVADSFIEAWRIKYTYWTERPDMAIEGFAPQFDNPYFPSYVSGHATVSQTAADILSYLIPQKTDQFQAQAQEAADSRLWAGVHFDMDNAVGQKLGRQVASSIIESREY